MSSLPAIKAQGTPFLSMTAGAAVFDDVIGFVLSSVIRTLGETIGSGDVTAWPLARPLVTSLLFAGTAPLVCKVSRLCFDLYSARLVNLESVASVHCWASPPKTAGSLAFSFPSR